MRSKLNPSTYRISRFRRRAVRKFKRQRPFKLTPQHLLSTDYGTPSRFDRSPTHMAMPAPPTWPRTPSHPRGCHSFRIAVRGPAQPWAASPRRADPHAPRARPVGRSPAGSAPAQHPDPTRNPSSDGLHHLLRDRGRRVSGGARAAPPRRWRRPGPDCSMVVEVLRVLGDHRRACSATARSDWTCRRGESTHVELGVRARRRAWSGSVRAP